MRNNWTHAPSAHQPTPDDNGSADVLAQVREWQATGVLVHPETAMQIASWWHSPAARDRGMTAFGSTGTVVLPEWEPEDEATPEEMRPVILGEIERRLGELPGTVAGYPEGYVTGDLGTEEESRGALLALQAYVLACDVANV